MPCGQYCYQRKWQCQGGRLRQLTNVQQQPGPTRNYGSESARENSIRRRVMSVKTNGSKTNYGPLFGGKKKPSVFSNCGFCGDRSVEEGKNVYYNNGGTSGINTYWNKLAAGPKGVGGMTCCSLGDKCDKNRLCGGGNGTTLLGGAPCSIGGKQWLNYRRFQPGAARA